MKVITILIIVSLIEIYGQQWIWQNPLPSSNGLKKITFLESGKGLAVGYRGTVLKTIDGNNWQLNETSNLIDALSSVFFIDNFIGWATSAGEGNIESGKVFKSLDGGENWEYLTTRNNKLLDIFFVDHNTGWLVGNGIVLKSTDGGNSWIDQIINPQFKLTSCFFTDTLTGWVIGNVILHTTDGGLSWEPQHGPVVGHYRSINFSDSLNGWIAGKYGSPSHQGKLIRSSDGGKTWFEIFNSGHPLTCVFFADGLNGWLSNEKGNIRRTTDGGANWFNAYDLGSQYLIEDLFFIDSNIGWVIISDGRIYKTINGGSNWIEQSKGQRWKVVEIDVIDSLTAWIITSPRFIVKTTDGGKSWESHSYNPTGYVEFFDLKFVDSVYGWICGFQINSLSEWNPLLLITIDGGQSWHPLPKPPGSNWNLNNLFFVNRNIGYLTDSYGMFKTTNSGFNWSRLNFDYGYIHNIFFLDSLKGWMLVAPGDIYTTNDGGQSWELSWSVGNTLYALFFHDSLNGYAGGTGAVLRTTDGGASWNYFSTGGISVYNIHFSDKYNGWAVGTGLLKTSDGGVTWEQVWSRAYSGINSVKLLEDHSGWFVGNNGTILKYYPEEPSNLDTHIIIQDIVFNKLHQNYPNPFNPSTKISWQSPVSNWQTLKVFDVLGRQVATLVDEYKEAGYHEVEFNSSAVGGGLASGVYYYRLKVDTFVETKKMILLQ